MRLTHGIGAALAVRDVPMLVVRPIAGLPRWHHAAGSPFPFAAEAFARS